VCGSFFALAKRRQGVYGNAPLTRKRTAVKNADLPCRRTLCETCPFRPGSPYRFLMADLAKSACEKASRICHSTGSSGLLGRTGLPEHICRGARQVQLKAMAAWGVISAPTDRAWNAARVAIGLRPTVVKDPAGKLARQAAEAGQMAPQK
jgi:hypothetical protein